MPDRLVKALYGCLAAAAVGTVLWQQLEFVLIAVSLPHTTVAELWGGWVETMANLSAHLNLFFVFGVVMVAIAMPLQALLQVFGRSEYLVTLGLGVVIGAVLTPLMLGFGAGFDAEPELGPLWRIRPWWSAVGAGMGLVMGTVAWLIRRPDRDGLSG